jgi:hypothetical protein
MPGRDVRENRTVIAEGSGLLRASQLLAGNQREKGILPKVVAATHVESGDARRSPEPSATSGWKHG